MITLLEEAKVWLPAFADDVVRRRSEVGGLERVDVEVLDLDDSRIASDIPITHKVRVLLRDGTVREAERSFAKGTIADPFSEDERRDKFMDCCALVMRPERAARLWDALDRDADASCPPGR